MQELLLYWLRTLERDIEGFADPGTEVSTELDGRGIAVSWCQREQRRSESFALGPEGDFRWLDPGTEQRRPYPDFLRSPLMADFPQLSSAIIRSFSREPNYVSTRAIVEDDSEPPEKVSDDLVLSEVDGALRSPSGNTKLIFVKGDAGAGKTTLLREITAEQAVRFQQGQAGHLFLYVSAQGRALSNLRDALAGETQDLRAAFTRDGVAPLTRHGLLVPIIDGFDELLGAAGYGDAFGSLRQFLCRLEGTGVVIVSARSSFYDVEFVGKEGGDYGAGALLELQPIALRRWQPEQIRQYFDSLDLGEAAHDRAMAVMCELPDSDRDLLGKPFFASRFPDYVASLDRQNNGTSLLDFLIDSFIDRESEKIVDRDGHPLVPREGHRMFFEETADLMWTTEDRRVTAGDLRVLAEIVAEECTLASDAAKQFVTKITSYAGFSTSQVRGEREFAFEHDVYFDHFLSEALRKKLHAARGGTSIGGYLDRAVLPNEVVWAAVRDEGTARLCLAVLQGVTDARILHENRRRNAGALLAAAFRRLGDVEDYGVRFCSFVNVSFGDCRLRRIAFHCCRFLATGLESARFEQCAAFDGCQAQGVLVSGDTILDIDGFVPGSVVVSVVDLVSGGTELFSPVEIAALLRERGAPLAEPQPPQPRFSDDGKAALELLRKICTKFRRTNILCLEDRNMRHVFGHRRWPALQRLLEEHRIVRVETRDASGSKKDFLRPLVDMIELMACEKELRLPAGVIGDFWEALRELKA